MQQAELIEILPELKAKVDDYNRYGTTQPTTQDIKIFECRQYNLKLKAEQEAKRSYWQRVQESRQYNLKMLAIAKQQKQEQREIHLLELVKKNKDILSSVR